MLLLAVENTAQDSSSQPSLNTQDFLKALLLNDAGAHCVGNTTVSDKEVFTGPILSPTSRLASSQAAEIASSAVVEGIVRLATPLC